MVARDPNPNFEDMGIPFRTELCELRLIKDPSKTVKIVGPSCVEYQGEIGPFGIITERLDNRATQYHTRYWTYNGRCLREIYEETQQAKRRMGCVRARD